MWSRVQLCMYVAMEHESYGEVVVVVVGLLCRRLLRGRSDRRNQLEAKAFLTRPTTAMTHLLQGVTHEKVKSQF